LAGAIELLERARQIAEWADAPWMIENPVSTFSSYWRKPDDRIHKAAPGPERANIRSATPMGFARAVFEANA
jgi:hypothetical protein